MTSITIVRLRDSKILCHKVVAERTKDGTIRQKVAQMTGNPLGKKLMKELEETYEIDEDLYEVVFNEAEEEINKKKSAGGYKLESKEMKDRFKNFVSGQ